MPKSAQFSCNHTTSSQHQVVLEQLLHLLQPEKIEKGFFLGQSQDLGFGAVFGGQVLGQALSSAAQSVSDDRFVHSLHSYFLRPGCPHSSILYDVENIRDGRSFSTRRVKAIQNGETIFYMTASFQVEEQGFEHQTAMPDVPGPEGLSSDLDLYRHYQDRIPEAVRDKFTCERPIQMRYVTEYNPFEPKVSDNKKYVWMKANGSLKHHPHIHKLLLAYASDFNFLPTTLQPHGESFINPQLKMATIDHAIWFHRPFRFDDWLLYSIESPHASNARGLVRGEIFNQHGLHVASTIQEGLIRYRQPQHRPQQ